MVHKNCISMDEYNFWSVTCHEGDKRFHLVAIPTFVIGSLTALFTISLFSCL